MPLQAAVSHQAQPAPRQSAEPKRQPEPEQGFSVSALVEEAKKHGASASLREELEHLSPRALARFAESLPREPKDKYDALRDLAEEIGDKKAWAKPQLFEGSETFGTTDDVMESNLREQHEYHRTNGRWAQDTDKYHHYNEFTYDKQAGGEGRTRTGRDAHLAEERHEAAMDGGGGGGGAGSFIAEHTNVEATVLGTSAEGQKQAWERSSQHGPVNAHARALGVAGDASARVAVGNRSVKLIGNAAATATLVQGGVEIATKPMPFHVAGENFLARFRFALDAGVLAQAQAGIEVNVQTSGAGVEAGVSGFAGARGLASAQGTLDWNKKSGEAYANEAAQHAANLLGMWLPSSMVGALPMDKVGVLLGHVLPAVLGADAGDVLVVAATLKGMASAGVGADASLSGSFTGGVVHCHGGFGATLGLGVGGNLDVLLGAVDGMRLLGVMMMRGVHAVGEALKPVKQVGAWVAEKAAEVRAAVRAYCKAYARDPEHSWIVRKLMGWIGSHV